jgi:2-polyprenyl-3-methyl-5-hydroxy-6-metoxy-1,4-benzoquinol methylase
MEHCDNRSATPALCLLAMNATTTPPVGEAAITRACSLCERELGVSDVRWTKDGFDVVECPRCRLVQRLSLPSPLELDEIYGDDYFRQHPDDTSGQGYLDYVADADEHRLNARRRLERIEATATRGTLLDVGAAAGFFVEVAAGRGWNPVGIDIAPSMTAYARDRLHVDVRTSDLRNADVTGPFDVITMWDYLEHAVDPVGDVERAAELLRAGGRLVLSTGDIASPAARASGARWHLLTPRHHNFYFSTTTMRRLLEGRGLVVEQIGHPAAWYSIRYLVHKVRTMLPPSSSLDRIVERLVASRAGTVALPVNLFDVMTVVARKPAGETRR